MARLVAVEVVQCKEDNLSGSSLLVLGRSLNATRHVIINRFITHLKKICTR